MALTSFGFFAFLGAAWLAVHYAVNTTNAKKNLLLLASYYFYVTWDWRFAGLVAATTVVQWATGIAMLRATSQRARKRYLAISLAYGLGCLAYFKYFNFFITELRQLLELVGLPAQFDTLEIFLPIGISFYTFQALTYTLDIHAGKITEPPSLRDFALFIAFFPHITSGPISRASVLLPQLRYGPTLAEQEYFNEGFYLITKGLVKKIALADILAAYLVNPALVSTDQHPSWFLLLALYGYSFQIYFDLSGYTDIARGSARLFGYDLPVNFDRPYLATSVSNFWQRWHISMSSFFRDYLFFSLGGSRHGNVYLNLLITFIAIGLWHGASWNFVLYGAAHGTMVCIERMVRNRNKAKGLISHPPTGLSLALRVFLVFSFVSIARVLFITDSLPDAAGYFMAVVSWAKGSIPPYWPGYVALAVGALIHFTPGKLDRALYQRVVRFPPVAKAALFSCCVYGLTVLSTDTRPFVYFQF